MTEIQKSVTLTGLTIAITTALMMTFGNNVFALEYSKHTNEKHGIEFNYYNIKYMDSKNPTFKERDNKLIIPVAANFRF